MMLRGEKSPRFFLLQVTVNQAPYFTLLLTLILSTTYAKILNKTCDFSFKITIGNGVSEIHTRPDNSKK